MFLYCFKIRSVFFLSIIAMAPPLGKRPLKPSGAANRSMKKRRDEEARKMSGSLNAFLGRPSQSDTSDLNPPAAVAFNDSDSDSIASHPPSLFASTRFSVSDADASVLPSTPPRALTISLSGGNGQPSWLMSSPFVRSSELQSGVREIDLDSATDDSQLQLSNRSSRAITSGALQPHDPSTWKMAPVCHVLS